MFIFILLKLYSVHCLYDNDFELVVDFELLIFQSDLDYKKLTVKVLTSSKCKEIMKSCVLIGVFFVVV